MTPDASRTVREIAIANPATVRIFEQLGIDYCCGGKRPLAEACERANVEVERVLEALDAVETKPGAAAAKTWNQASFREIIDHIVTAHHGYVRQEGPRLEALLDRVVNRHGDAHPELAAIRDIFLALNQELIAHMFKEEHILFPFVKEMESAVRTGGPIPLACFDSVGTPIARMIADHDDAGELLSKMRTLSSDYQAPAGACPSYLGLYQGLLDFERDLHTHVHLENNVLFPRALETEQALRREALA